MVKTETFIVMKYCTINAHKYGIPTRANNNANTIYAKSGLEQGFQATQKPYEIIPTRCRDLHLKQFCLEDIAPAVRTILITHIIIAVRRMLIKILSVVINGREWFKVIVPGFVALL